MKSFIDEFKKFLNKGNAVELAIGVIMGSAFTNIVNSIVNDIISPIIGLIGGGFDFSNIKIHLYGDAYIQIGSFIQNIINFIIVSFVLFVIIRSMNRIDEIKNKKAQTNKDSIPAEEPEEIKILKSIESEIKKINK